MNSLPSLAIRAVSETDSLLQKANDECDGVIVFFSDKNALMKALPASKTYADLDAGFGDAVRVIVSETKVPAARIVIAPVGSIRGDFDDVRRYKDAAFAAGKRALKAGIRSPNVYFADVPGGADNAWTEAGNEYKHFIEVTLLGLLDSTFEPIDAREHYARVKADVAEFEKITVFTEESILSQAAVSDLLKHVEAIEIGRRVSIDIGSPDPERMSPANIVEYLQTAFKNDKNIKLTVIDDIAEIKKNYPLAHAVTRASLAVPRHHPRFVHFEYKSPNQTEVKENLYFVGKGVTYDTGGADIKCSGHMRAMSHDKCGAATVAGFMKTLSLLQPNKVNVRAGIALVRNSVGSDSYVSDEIIYSRSGTRVLVGNTDAEGRMVMTDLLCEFKEQVIAEKQSNTPASKAPSFLITVATLTGHALRAYDGYGIALDNGFSRRHKISKRIYEAGHILADPFETSTFRREDIAVVRPGRSSEDVVQANDKASTATNRGHQYPAGFMLIASGLDKHGLDSETPIGFTHMDVAGSAETIDAVGWSIPRVTGSPVPALTGAFAL